MTGWWVAAAGCVGVLVWVAYRVGVWVGMERGFYAGHASAWRMRRKEGGS